jgi:hypothetical protein
VQGEAARPMKTKSVKSAFPRRRGDHGVRENLVFVQPQRSPSAATIYNCWYVVEQRCVLRYDNERGKGDHRHTETVEEPYAFSTPDQLTAEFEADVGRWNREHGRA